MISTITHREPRTGGCSTFSPVGAMTVGIRRPPHTCRCWVVGPLAHNPIFHSCWVGLGEGFFIQEQWQ
jgi:hypothetical protein